MTPTELRWWLGGAANVTPASYYLSQARRFPSVLGFQNTTFFELISISFEELFLFQRIQSISERPMNWENLKASSFSPTTSEYAQTTRDCVFKESGITLPQL